MPTVPVSWREITSFAMVYTEDRLYHMTCCCQRFDQCAIDTHARQQRAIEDLTINIMTKRDTSNGREDPERAVISMIAPLKDIATSSLYEPRKKYKTLANALIVNARDVGGESFAACLLLLTPFFASDRSQTRTATWAPHACTNCYQGMHDWPETSRKRG